MSRIFGWYKGWEDICAPRGLSFCVVGRDHDLVDAARLDKSLFYALIQESANVFREKPASKYVRPLFRVCLEQTALYTVSCEIHRFRVEGRPV